MNHHYLISAYGISDIIIAETRGKARMKVARTLVDSGFAKTYREAFMAIRAIAL